MVSRTCDQCGASVAADEQFCPTCGSFIDPMAPAPAPRRSRKSRPENVIAVNSDGNYEEFSLEEPAQQRATPPPKGGNGDGVECPSCGAVNPASNRHCQECGARLRQGPLPTAPRPAVQATAGVRAAVAISGLLFVVVVVALLFNVFSDSPSDTTSTLSSSTSTSGSIAQTAVIEVIDVDCDPAGLGSLVCANLTKGEGNEYQTDWEALDTDGGEITIRLSFRQPMIIDRLEWRNIDDETRFKQNYRARGIILKADGSLTTVNKELDDTPGMQVIDYPALNATFIDITVVSAYLHEVIDGNTYSEIAIDEITVWGRPVT